MKEDKIFLEIPLAEIEEVFTALHQIKPNQHTRMENKAVSILRERIYFAIEAFIETPEEKEERHTGFMQLFNREKKKRKLQQEESKAEEAEEPAKDLQSIENYL